MDNYIGIGLSVASGLLVLLMIKHGYGERLFAASALFLRLVLSFLFAMTFYRALAHWIVSNIPAASEYVTIRVCFLIILWGSYLILTELFERWMEPEHVIVPNVMDRLGGMIFGALAGAVLAGLFLMTWTFLPYASRLGPFPKIKPVDMGEVLIQEYANLSNRMGKSGVFNRRQEIAAYRSMHEPAPSPEPGSVPSQPAGKPEAPGSPKPVSQPPLAK